MLSEYFEVSDIYKALLSLVAGLVLGYEREMKDKAAGLKTITIICLGSTLFTLLSYKFAGDGDPTRIASYIVSGIGFLGAGVIFKEGFTVYGLTTAGIIWMAAAIGMSIGFGEIVLAFIFLAFAFLVIYSAVFLNRFILPQYTSRMLTLEINIENIRQRREIISEMEKIARKVIEVNFEKRNELIIINAELHINEKDIPDLEDFLLKNKNIRGFQL